MVIFMDDYFRQQLGEWKKTIAAYRFPRWEELPEIDFYMDQIITFTEKRLAVFQGEGTGKLITPSIINNYVKLKIIPPPVKKRYSRTHIAYLLMICCLKTVMPIPSIQNLIEYRLKSVTLPEVYDSFCEEQEAASQAALEKSDREYGDIFGKLSDAEKALGILTVRMAVSANSDKLIAEKIASINKKPVSENDKKAP
jgi:DNA-binding transcriptional MerR regulator